MSKRPFLLITNDDGIQAPGLKHLWECVSDFADVAIVAPHGEKSGAGLSITWTKPLRIHPILWENGVDAWSVNGTPADCVKMALSVLLEKKPDLIISGINRGSNAGRTVLYSGTIGGVIEGVFKNVPGIAFSFSDFDIPSIEKTKVYIQFLIQHFLKGPLPEGTFLNVTFPVNFKEECKGFRFTKQGRGYWNESPERRLHPQGIPYYWLGGKWKPFDESEESDVTLSEKGFVTATPIHVGHLTDLKAYEKHKLSIEKSFDSKETADQPQ